jgi:membrane dipeptidase
MRNTALSAVLGALVMAIGSRAGSCQMPNAALMAKAQAIHRKTLTLDTHVDISPSNFQTGQLNYGQRLGTQVDLTKMEDGGLDAIFFSIFVGQGALDSAGYAAAYATDTAKFNAIHRLVDSIAPGRIGLALTADDARSLFRQGKKIAFMGVENGYGIGTDITRVKEFYDRGARYLSLAHNGHNQLSDSNTGEADNVWMWHGISPLGKEVIREENKWGIMIDISHPSRESMMQAIQLSRAPLIASHSAVRSLCDVSRNLDDDQLKALAKNGGVIQVVAFRGYIKCDPKGDAARSKALADLRAEFGIAPGSGRGGGNGGATGAGGRGTGGGRGAAGAAGNARGGGRGPAAGVSACAPIGGPAAATVAADSQLASLPDARRQDYDRRLQAIMQRYPRPAVANVKDLVDHIDYAVKLMGIDHVGISSDFDGGGGIEGYNCALDAINVTTELVRRGYTEEQIGKIWSGNLLRVLDEVQHVAKTIQGEQGIKTGR